MIDLKFIRQNADQVQQAAKNKGVEVDIAKLIELDDQQKKIERELDDLRATQKKQSSKTIDEATRQKLKNAKITIKSQQEALEAIESQVRLVLYRVPNIPLPDVPVGPDESANKELRLVGKKKDFPFEPKDHVTLGESLGLLDIRRASKVAGSRFAYIKGAAALMQFALVQYVLSIVTSATKIKTIISKAKLNVDPKPFIPVIPPVMIKPDIFEQMGRLNPEDREERYYLQQDDLFLIGSAEHTLGSMHANETLMEETMPLRYIGYSTSFRREAGSYGKDTRGILRVHQFDKLELESFTSPETSFDEHLLFVAIQERIMQSLELPYRVVLNATGDMGKPNARQIDIETWIPSEKKYRETHSADHMTDFQSRRLGTRVKKSDGAVVFAHTNDATAIAIGRTLIAIIENYQQADGTILVPKVLQPWMGGLTVIG